MNIAVIGTINRDTIYPYDGPRIESYGGILYNLVALSSLMKKQVRLYPICNLGADIHRTVLDRLEELANTNIEGIRIVRLKNNHAILRYSTPSDRNEFLENRLPTLTFHHIEPFLDCDFLLINFISGHDLNLSTLKRIRHHFKGTIFVDIHSLTLGISTDGQRIPRRPDEWTEWVRQADICQLSLDESRILAGRALHTDDEVAQFAKQLLTIGPRIVLITLGPKGSFVASRSESGTALEHCPANTVSVVDTTGCGDIFSAGFISEYIRSRDPMTANRFANRVAAANCTLRGLEELHTISDLVSEP